MFLSYSRPFEWSRTHRHGVTDCLKVRRIEAERQADGYRVIPVLLPGVGPAVLELWFEEEPDGVGVELKTGGIGEAMLPILAALGVLDAKIRGAVTCVRSVSCRIGWKPVHIQRLPGVGI